MEYSDGMIKWDELALRMTICRLVVSVDACAGCGLGVICSDSAVLCALRSHAVSAETSPDAAYQFLREFLQISRIRMVLIQLHPAIMQPR